MKYNKNLAEKVIGNMADNFSEKWSERGDLYYHCLICDDLVSTIEECAWCSCNNIDIDLSMGIMRIKDPKKVDVVKCKLT